MLTSTMLIDTMLIGAMLIDTMSWTNHSCYFTNNFTYLTLWYSHDLSKHQWMEFRHLNVKLTLKFIRRSLL
ncbi:hypothetical protein EB796_009080 [Bugula neritina]|uniref:Uncharacterized protein n=1 Tax=Bugula neritina TaxID=10212 RepID=A0A7J7K4S1_BUGNE|nr:hypothetical protein EB796_009080 [Bugula neritina]